MTWYFYAVRCRDGAIYAGITTDIERRVKQHNSGRGAKYLRPRKKRPVKLVFSQKCKDKSEALMLEAIFKKFPRSTKLAVISSGAFL